MPGPEQQTEQTKEQKLDEAMQSITASINNIRQNEGKEDIHNINEMIDSEFLKNIDQRTASDIITIIDALGLKDKELPKDLKNLRDVLEPIAAQNIQGFGSLNNFTNAEQEDLDKKQQKLVKEINSQISELTSQITDSSLKDILNQVNTIVTHLNSQNKEQLANFLTANGIEIQDQNDNTMILNGVNQFLEKIGQRIKDEKESAAVLNERAANAQQFGEFLKTIRALKWEDLDTYWHDRYLDKICTFIEHNPKNEDVIDAYIIMKQINLENESNIGSRDKTVFKDVFNTLNNLYGKKDGVEDNIYRQKAAQRYWDLKFYERDKKNISIVDIITTENGLNRKEWNGSSLQEDGDKKDQIQNLVNNMQGKSFDFDAKYFIENFNKRNEERINNNVDAIKGVNIINILKSVQGDDILNKIEGRGNSDSLTIKLDDSGNSVKLDEQVLLELIGDYEFKPSDLPEGKGSFISDSEIFDTVQLRSTEITPSWLKQIADRPLEEQSGDNEDAENHEGEGTLDALKLEDSDIKIYPFSGLKPKDIVDAVSNATGNLENYTDQYDKTKFTQRIKEVVSAVKEGGASPKNGSETIRKLQGDMNAVLSELNLKKQLVPDGKLGKNTLYVMKLYIGASVDNSDKLNYEVSRGRLSQRQKVIYDRYIKGETESLQSELCDDGEDLFDRVMEELDTSPNGCRKELSKLVEGKNFPGKDIIAGDNILKNHDKLRLKSIQLQLVPYYKGRIDGAIGPLTVKAVEDYISANDKGVDTNNNGSEIVQKLDANLARLDSAGNLDATGDDIKAVIDKDSKHAYFLEGDDFTYEIDSRKTEIKATVTKAKNAPMNYKFIATTPQKLTTPDNTEYDQTTIISASQDIKNMFDNMSVVLNKLGR